MIMETLSCGYPVGPTGLGSSPMTPPASPPDTHSFNPHECSPQLYSETQYAQTTFSSTPIHHHNNFLPRYVEDDANNNNSIYKSIHDDRINNNSTDALLGDLSSLSISEQVIEEEDDLSNRFSASDFTPPPSEVSETDEIASQISSTRSTPKSSISSVRSTKSKKNSRSKAKTSTESTDSGFSSRIDDDPSSRKDSFVYDVRLPDEQFLFFVPDLDLVKSHLMFAVREEVDVLKDRIVELMDRIKHLECENSVLRQYASPEVLQQLPNPLPPHQMQQPPHHPTTS
ncbi:TSC22 domain family protein 4 [Armadillidium vulgare]|nr:TSC22 domain family protein 4 [Armadillidium vulgare]